MGRKAKSRGRDVHGVLLLDKPVGVTSNTALQQLKRLFNARKAGHTGSLDKPASGLLPLCFGEATKFSSYLLDSDKTYVATCKLGVTTTTADASGEVIEKFAVPRLSGRELEKILARFRGDISQVPPMHSALKQDGQPLYKLAYQGREVERNPRQVTVYSLKLLDLRNDEFDIEVHCSKGTYIRTLVEDIGKAVGCGAYVLSLRRVAVGPYNISAAVTIEHLRQLSEAGEAHLNDQLLPVDSMLGHFPEIEMNEILAFYLRRGQAVMVTGAPTSGLVRIRFNGEFIGIGEVQEDGRIAPKRLLSQ
jgi:tRNA pseudouridine55 synthase